MPQKNDGNELLDHQSRLAGHRHCVEIDMISFRERELLFQSNRNNADSGRSYDDKEVLLGEIPIHKKRADSFIWQQVCHAGNRSRIWIFIDNFRIYLLQDVMVYRDSLNECKNKMSNVVFYLLKILFILVGNIHKFIEFGPFFTIITLQINLKIFSPKFSQCLTYTQNFSFRACLTKYFNVPDVPKI